MARSPLAPACTAGFGTQEEEAAGNWLDGCNIAGVGMAVAGIGVACPLRRKRADAVAGSIAAAYGRCIDNGRGLAIFQESFASSC